MRKRIKISESQLKLLQSVTEETPDMKNSVSKEELTAEYDKLVEYKKNVFNKMDRYYNLITSYSINEIIKNKEVIAKLDLIYKEIEKIEANSYQLSSKIENKTETLSDEEFDNWGNKLEINANRINNDIWWKKTALEDLINMIKDMVDGYNEKEIDRYFKENNLDIKI